MNPLLSIPTTVSIFLSPKFFKNLPIILSNAMGFCSKVDMSLN